MSEPPAAQRGDLLLLRHALEAADHGDAAGIQLRQDAVRRDVSDASLSVQRFGLDARLQGPSGSLPGSPCR